MRGSIKEYFENGRRKGRIKRIRCDLLSRRFIKLEEDLCNKHKYERIMCQNL